MKFALQTWLLVPLLSFGGVAFAQPSPIPPPPGPSSADQIYDEGRKHYDLREWDQAIAKFKEAYRVRPDARSLFNIAQSYRLKGDCVEAASYYKTYKRNFPQEKNIALVDKFIVEMDACAKTATPVNPTNPTGTNPTGTNPTGTNPTGTNPAVTDPTKPPDPANPDGVRPDPNIGRGPDPIGPRPETPSGSPGRGLRITGLVVGGIGAAGIVVGVISGLSAKSTAEEVEGLETWDPDLDDKGKSADLRAKIFLGVGAGALVTGGVLYFVGMKQGESAQSVSFVPRTDGGMVVWSGKL